MGKFKSYVLVIVSLLISFAIVMVLGFNAKKTNPNEVYKVYIDGPKMLQLQKLLFFFFKPLF